MTRTLMAVFMLLAAAPVSAQQVVPDWLLGPFEDDYGSRYAITREMWIHEPRTTYHIVSWNADGEYLIARNDDGNPSDGGLWTRIDWMRFDDTPPYEWGFCISAWSAATREEAEASVVAQRATPRTGCGGYPFSRMKRAVDAAASRHSEQGVGHGDIDGSSATGRMRDRRQPAPEVIQSRTAPCRAGTCAGVDGDPDFRPRR